MVLYRRNLLPGGTYFLTINLRDRQSALLTKYAHALRNIVTDVRRELPFHIDAMCVMPDHMHAVWTLPPADSDYAKRVQAIKARFTAHLLQAGDVLHKDARGEYNVWQKRYWEHTVRDERDFEAHVNYVHINPVKHGHAVRAADWPHSTIHPYIKNQVVSADWACEPVDGKFGE